MEETTLLRVDRSVYLSWVQENPAVLEKVLILIEQALGTAYNKLLNNTSVKELNTGYVWFFICSTVNSDADLNFTCKEIAELSGTTTETVIRIISKLKKNQHSHFDRKKNRESLIPTELKLVSKKPQYSHGWI